MKSLLLATAVALATGLGPAGAAEDEEERLPGLLEPGSFYDHNTARILQDGRGNSLSVRQSGVANRSLILQRGRDNRAEHRQEGAANEAATLQKGEDNHSRIEQLGDANTAIHRQYGEGNAFGITQRGDGMNIEIIQRR